jgi:hypothetical protein
VFTYRLRGLTVGEAWFGEEPVRDGLDIVFHIQRGQPLEGAHCRVKHTLLVDLTLDEDDLQKAFDADLRWRLRRAEKDALVYQHLDAGDARVRDGFCAFHAQWAAEKGHQALQRRRLDAMAEAGHLDLSAIATLEGKSLTCSAYYVDGGRARGLYRPSCLDYADTSRQRQIMGRASRYLVWRDMLRYKADGYTLFDFGGWYNGATDQQLLRINAFKKEFGGRVVQEWNCDEGVTWRGKLALWARRRLGRAD